ncbi:MAG: trigger factor [Acidimicrobiales bacterium]
MRATAEAVEPNKVKLSVELDDAEIESAVDAALRRMAKEVNVPGFRPGKVPRRILEARVGPVAIRQAALNESVPGFYAKALRETDVDAIAEPQIEVTGGAESGTVSFDATVEVRPKISIPGYQGLAVTLPDIVVSDTDVADQLDRMRAQNAELAVVDRAAAQGDHLVIDVATTRGGQALESFGFDDLSYELGSASIVPEVDTELVGHIAGDVVAFNAQVAGSEAQLVVSVKQVKEKVLPEATDEWAAVASEFETLEQLRAHLRRRLTSIKRDRARAAVRDLALDALLELVDDDPPESLVNAEMQRRIQDFGQHLDRRKMDLARYLSMAGITQEELVTGFRNTGTLAVKADLALRALIEAESITITEDDLEAELVALAKHLKQDPVALRETLEHAHQLDAVRGDVRKAKALDWLEARVALLDQEGQPVDRAELEAEPDDATELTDTEPDDATESTDTEPTAAAEPDSTMESQT